MFGAPPVGHVMDPQFKPVFFGVMEMVKWGLHVHTSIHDIMYINGRL